MAHLQILERFSSSLPSERQEALEKLKQRKVSTSSQLSQASSSSEFINIKIQDVSDSLKFAEQLRLGLSDALNQGLIPEAQYHEAIKEVEVDSRPCEQEIVILKRQKKIITEDLQDKAPSHSKLEDAYASLITNKVMGAMAKQTKRNFDQSGFKSKVLEYYEATRVVGDPADNDRDLFCHLTGWHHHSLVKASHIVPKSLQSDELSYLFGVGEAVLSDPRNAICLQRVIELALDSGLVVLVPVVPEGGEEVRWKCVTTNKSKNSRMITAGIHYKDIDGKELQFLGNNRPARRFLYFRFVISYLHCKRQGNLEWVAEVEAKGHMWPSPGPYLRRSLLVSLARKISDVYLPEAFYEGNTFTDSDGCAARSKEEEDDLALALVLRVKEEKEMAEERIQSGDMDDDDEEEGF